MARSSAHTKMLVNSKVRSQLWKKAHCKPRVYKPLWLLFFPSAIKFQSHLHLYETPFNLKMWILYLQAAYFISCFGVF